MIISLLIICVVFAAPSFANGEIFLKGLVPNAVINAAAPIKCIPAHDCFLQAAILDAFNTNDLNSAEEKMNCNGKVYLGQNNSQIINGTFDIHGIKLPEQFVNAEKVKITITLAGESYKEVKGEPELALGLYKNITPKNLSKKFETQQFLHPHFMKRYEVGLKTVSKCYECGAQELSGVINMKDLKGLPLQIVVKYTENGFHFNQKKLNPKVKNYAYVVEFEKIS